jgi:hypothetical protein
MIGGNQFIAKIKNKLESTILSHSSRARARATLLNQANHIESSLFDRLSRFCKNNCFFVCYQTVTQNSSLIAAGCLV